MRVLIAHNKTQMVVCVSSHKLLRRRKQLAALVMQIAHSTRIGIEAIHKSSRTGRGKELP